MVTQKTKSDGINGTIIIFLIFLILKLTGNIDWSWIWVTSPLWLPIVSILGITLIISTFVILIMLIKLLFDKKTKN
jgi:hypothetical protein